DCGRVTSNVCFGMQDNDKECQTSIAQGTGFARAGVKNVASESTRSSWDEFAQVKSLGFFVQEQVAWRDRLYVTGSVREDNSSVFGSNINQLYYPKLSAAYVVSEERFLQRLTCRHKLKAPLAADHARK